MSRISIITVVFNAGETLAATITSIAEQTWQDRELVIIDGGSTDNTHRIIEENKRLVDIYISEKDRGIYDAMNKGLRAATGDYVIFINAGDLFYDRDVLAKMMASYSDADVYYGNTMIVDSNGNDLGERRLKLPENLNWHSLQWGMVVSHQSILARKSLCGEFNLNYKISADIDWTIRLLKNSKTIVNTHMFVSRFLAGGTSAKRRRLGLRERFEIMVVHYGLMRTLLNHFLILFRYFIHLLSGKSGR